MRSSCQGPRPAGQPGCKAAIGDPAEGRAQNRPPDRRLDGGRRAGSRPGKVAADFAAAAAVVPAASARARAGQAHAWDLVATDVELVAGQDNLAGPAWIAGRSHSAPGVSSS